MSYALRGAAHLRRVLRIIPWRRSQARCAQYSYQMNVVPLPPDINTDKPFTPLLNTYF